MSKRTSPICRFRRANARRLRASTTGAEIALWKPLRKLETNGTHFRRQVPIGPYVADFACTASCLVIELDGSHHGEEPTKTRDDARARWLESERYRVIRFWNNDIIENLDGVLETIYAALYGSRDADQTKLKHLRRLKGHPTPARHSESKTRVNALMARRPSPPGEGDGARIKR